MFDLLDKASLAEVDLIVFPENNTYEWLAWMGDYVELDVPKRLSDHALEYEEFLVQQSKQWGMIIVGGSHLVQTGRGIENVCAVAFPNNPDVVRCPKVKLTQYEVDPLALTPGEGLVKLPDPNLGVLVCYDSEFPEAARVLAESGVKVLIVPAFTETIFGFHRVRWCCLARAVENQCFVVHASLVGSLNREPVPMTYGSSAIIRPSLSEISKNPNDLVVKTKYAVEEMVVADLNLADLEACRNTGDVRNWNDRDPSCWKF